MSITAKRIILWGFYGGLGILLILITTGALRVIIPAFSTRIAYNSEAYLFAVGLGVWIQLILPRIRASARLRWALMVGAVWALIGVGLLLSDLPSRIRTLNESALALAVLVPYVTLGRPLRRWAVLLVPVLVVLTVWAVIWAPESWVIDQAETFGFVVLTILTLDLFDRVLLDPTAPVRKGFRLAWYGFMILEPIAVSGLGTGIRTGGGGLALTLEYLGRIHESFVGVLLVALILHLVRDYRAKLTTS